jgi:glycine/D-amino acid oxidase-like deaminating enzyme
MPEHPKGPMDCDTDTTSGNASLWLAGPTPPPRPPLRGEVTADVAVIGGGIAGVTTALRLQQAGVSVALLEARTVGSGVTGCTSAKVSALQATTLSAIASRHGNETAAVYAAASRQAVADVAALADELTIDCDLDLRPAVTYAADPSELEAVAGEYDTALASGLSVTWNDTDAGMPYEVSGAMWLDDQIGFQPVHYVRGLAEALVAQRLALPGSHRPGRAERRSGGRRHPLPDPRPRRVLRTDEGPAVLLRRRPDRRRASVRDGD